MRRPATQRLGGLLALFWAATAMAADLPRGQRLHDKQCVSCHAERYGGDGSGIYLRPDRLIHDRPGLEQRVAVCNKMTRAGLSAADEKNVSAYLDLRFYKFKSLDR